VIYGSGLGFLGLAVAAAGFRVRVSEFRVWVL